MKICPKLQVFESWVVKSLHDGGQHDGDTAGAHLGVVAQTGEESGVTSPQYFLPQTQRDVLQPLPQTSLHGLRDVDGLEPQLLPPEDLQDVLSHSMAANVSEGGRAGADLLYTLHDHCVPVICIYLTNNMAAGHSGSN